MKDVLPATVFFMLAFGGAACAQSGNGGSSPKGYESDASTSGRGGMSSSRTAPTSPTAGQPGTTRNGADAPSK